MIGFFLRETRLSALTLNAVLGSTGATITYVSESFGSTVMAMTMYRNTIHNNPSGNLTLDTEFEESHHKRFKSYLIR